ncbi:Uncharacterised protein [Vibrio cholerae]|nr:Uncharacterised protein [Vibrio cholerae]
MPVLTLTLHSHRLIYRYSRGLADLPFICSAK